MTRLKHSSASACRGKSLMMRLAGSIVMLGLLASSTCAETAASPKKPLHFYRTQHAARTACPHDRIVWASTSSRTLYLPGNPHYQHTPGGYVCESAARANGYRGPTARG
jgi:hypothetical protein